MKNNAPIDNKNLTGDTFRSAKCQHLFGDILQIRVTIEFRALASRLDRVAGEAVKHRRPFHQTGRDTVDRHIRRHGRGQASIEMD